MIDVLNSDASSPIQKLHELQVIIGITERCGSEFSRQFFRRHKKRHLGRRLSACFLWWAHQDSNLEPRDYESPALTVEL